MKQIKITLLFLLIGSISTYAWKEPKSTGRTDRIDFRVDCTPGQSVAELDVNNVRARLSQSGSLFLADGDGRYIVPKVDPSTGAEEVSSIYSAAVWIGGLQSGNFKVAAVQSGLSSGDTDWYPGPLDASGEISQATCNTWDKHFVVEGIEITDFRRIYDQNGSITLAEVPVGVLGWPAKGNPYFFDVHGFSLPPNNEPLAGFFDRNFDGLYDPLGGDFPIIEIRDCNSDDPPIPDQMHFWIFNDNGNFHAESNGDPIRMEVQVQTFAFSTNDAINNMTFYRNKMINRAPQNIDSMFFANWADADLGCSEDDYIGCDTVQSLATVYNVDDVDGINDCNCNSVPTYCNNVPMLGIDYFRGPLTPTISIRDTVIHKNEIISETDLVRIFDCTEKPGTDSLVCSVDYEIELGMSSFVYHARQSLPAGQLDPTVASEYYNYLSGSWRDGTPITRGGTGYNPGSTDITRYVFPSPPNDMSNGAWSMTHIDDQGNQFPVTSDPRLLQASGPFVLEPGKINELIVGIVWVPDIPDYPAPSIQPLLEADVAAQGLFDECFDILDGPQAPDLCVIELDQELILTLSNPECSNNFLEAYSETDIFAPEIIGDPTATEYLFEGYTIFQLANESVGPSELGDSDKARLFAQVDVTNGVSSIYNWTTVEHPRDGNPGVFVPVLQVDGEDGGTRHSFQVTQDLFASGSGNNLINHKKYFYMVLSYAHNNYNEFDLTTGQGQKNLFLTGRQSSCGREIQTYIGIPRPIVADDLASNYGDGAIITRTEGQGAGGRFLRIEPSQQDAIFDETLNGRVEYLPGAAPIEVKVFNPLAVIDGKYSIRFTDSDIPDNALINGEWELFDEFDNSITTSDFSVDQFNEQLVAELGISISVGQTNDAGDRVVVNGNLQDRTGDDNGLLGLELEYTTNNETPWFDSYQDEFAPPGLPFLSQIWNYIQTNISEVDEELDFDNNSYSNFGNGLFYPYTILSISNANDYQGPGWQGGNNARTSRSNNEIETLNNVNVVMTSDKSKWSRCVVLETATNFTGTNQFGVQSDLDNMEVSNNPSVGKNDNDGDGLADEDGEGRQGMGWFPGFAYDVETGQRLNILFGENSAYDPGNFRGFPAAVINSLTGDDLMLNPAPFDLLPLEITQPEEFQETGLYFSGSGHMIYVTNEKYDSCNTIQDDLLNGGNRAKRETFEKFKWASYLRTTQAMSPLNGNDEPGLIPEDLIVRLRCDNRYDYSEASAGENFGYPRYEFELTGVEKTPKEFAGETTVLDNIMAVPNPYYGFSAYETGILDNRIKITNLPDKATITIYSLDGKFIRQYDRNEEPQIVTDPTAPLTAKQTVPDLDWDLENFAGIPVSSGIYIIHVAAPGIGEKVIKWFGIQREFNPAGL